MEARLQLISIRTPPLPAQSQPKPGGSWLTIAAPTGTTTFGTPYAITGTSQTGQAAGTYTGTLSLSGSAFQPDNQTINVTLDVTTSPIIQTNNQNVLLDGYAGGPQVTSVISFNNIGMGTLTITGASIASAINGLFSLNVTSANSITITANPALVSPGLYTATITLASNAANSAQVSIPVELTVSEAGLPDIDQGGIVNIATFQPDTLAPGDIVSIWGDQFTAVGAWGAKLLRIRLHPLPGLEIRPGSLPIWEA